MHDEEYEAVLHPLTSAADPATAIAVDYDERDLLPAAPGPVSFVLPDAPIKAKTFWSTMEKDLVSQLVRARTIEIFANRQLKVFSRAGETKDDFAVRCKEAAAARPTRRRPAPRQVRDKAKACGTAQATQDRAQVLQAEASGRQQEELLSTAGSLLASFLGGRKRSNSLATELRGSGRTALRCARRERLDAAQGKAGSISGQLSERRPTCPATSSSPVRGTRRPPSTRCR